MAPGGVLDDEVADLITKGEKTLKELRVLDAEACLSGAITGEQAKTVKSTQCKDAMADFKGGDAFLHLPGTPG